MSFCDGMIPPNYRHERSFRQTIQRKIEDFCPQAEGFAEAKRESKFIRVAHGRYRHASTEYGLAIGEIEAAEGLIEGAVKQIAVNAYERSATARRLCVAYHGYACKCCGFNFEQVYGVHGKEYSGPRN
ncbi:MULTISPECIES: hypothetical protein [unclassified Duganella]|uniref:hypothetical protein n=1 Tax=unclassified Duganella TaxID=2636909 RepID=UPI0012E38E38|nr:MULTISPECIES: hypothetical protein [unclassified Duganella]